MRAALVAALLILPLPGMPAAPAAEALLQRLAARDFAVLSAELARVRADSGPDADVAAWRTFRAFALPAARTEEVEAWLESAPTSYDAHLAAALHYRGLGWYARGTAYAHKTTPARYAEARAHFTNAMSLAQSSLALAPRPILSQVLMLDVGRHLPGAEDAADIYATALAAEPRSLLLRAHRLEALQPKWGGSFDAMDELLREAGAAGLPPADLAALDALRLAYMAAHEEDQGKDREGIALAERSLAARESAYGHVLRGRMLRKLGNENAAQSAFERAVQLDPSDRYALNNLAQGLRLRGQRALALEAYKRAALAGNDWSANEVGQLLLRGHAGFPRRPREAFDWFTLGARIGNADAMYNLGECYREGDCGADIKRDYAQALHWYRRAESYGGELGSLGLAAMLWDGLGVERDDGEAVRLWVRTVRSEDEQVRRVSRLNLAHLVDLRRGVPALVRATGRPAYASAVLAAMVLLPLVALGLALRDGALRLTRRAPAGVARRYIPARRAAWLAAWSIPPLAGTALWIVYALGFLGDFRFALPLLALLCAPSVMVLYGIATGEWKVAIDNAGLRYTDVGVRHEIAWGDIASAVLEDGRIRMVTRSKQVHVLDCAPFGKALWREIEAHVKS